MSDEVRQDVFPLIHGQKQGEMSSGTHCIMFDLKGLMRCKAWLLKAFVLSVNLHDFREKCLVCRLFTKKALFIKKQKDACRFSTAIIVGKLLDIRLDERETEED